MKVVLLNGSPHEAGCTFTALSEVAKELNKTEWKQRSCSWGKIRCEAVSPAAAVRKPGNVPLTTMWQIFGGKRLRKSTGW